MTITKVVALGVVQDLMMASLLHLLGVYMVALFSKEALSLVVYYLSSKVYIISIEPMYLKIHFKPASFIWSNIEILTKPRIYTEGCYYITLPPVEIDPFLFHNGTSN